jgi:hypothetical protein
MKRFAVLVLLLAATGCSSSTIKVHWITPGYPPNYFRILHGTKVVFLRPPCPPSSEGYGYCDDVDNIHETCSECDPDKDCEIILPPGRNIYTIRALKPGEYVFNLTENNHTSVIGTSTILEVVNK